MADDTLLSPTSEHTSSPFTIPDNNQDLRDGITRLAGHINAAEYRFLKMLAALVEREAWGEGGFKSPAHWLNYACGLDLNAAREKVRVAKRLAHLPKIDEAFRLGTLSYAKVRAMTRTATPENEEAFLMIARHGTAQHVENLVRKYRRYRRLSAPEQDKAQYEAREFSWYTDEDGMLVFHGRLPPEDGAVFLKAMEAWCDVVNREERDRVQQMEDVSAETSSASHTETPENVSAETSVPELTRTTYSQKRADALVRMAEQALHGLSAGPLPLSNPEKYQIIVHLEPERLGNGLADPGNSPDNHVCSLECGESHFSLSSATARRLTCDASLVPVLEDGDGNVLNIGRKTRAIPPAISRALRIRDQGCRFPGCTQSRYVDAHHVQHWCDGGETSLDNLITLCRYHHRLLHQEAYTIVNGAGGEFAFVKSDGKRMPRALPQQFLDAEDTGQTPAIEMQQASLGIDADTAQSLWQGEPCDYGMAVEAMMAMDGKAIESSDWVGTTAI